uniref:Transposase n=1 Tax=Panagrellus redivivus TaxID=6233 RepID=A0A7E4ZTU2_PANRE
MDAIEHASPVRDVLPEKAKRPGKGRATAHATRRRSDSEHACRDRLARQARESRPTWMTKLDETPVDDFVLSPDTFFIQSVL